MISIISLIFVFTYLYCLSFIVGYILLRDNFIKLYSILVMLPIFTATGLSVIMLASYITGFVFIHWSILIAPLFLLALTFLLRSSVNGFKVGMKVSAKALFKGIMMLILNAIPLAYFIMAANVMRWPMPGDIIGHGLYVSLLRYNRRLSFMFEQLSSYMDYYPRGFHVFAANLAELTGLYSGEAVLVTGAFLSSLMPPLLFSLTYMVTGSLILSLIPYLASFYIHSTGHLGRWVFGYFYNGPYPCFTGILCYVLLTCLLVLFRKSNSTKALFSIFLVLTQLLTIYPNFFITVAPITLLLLRGSLWQFIKKLKWLIMLLTPLIVITLLTVFPVATHYLSKYLTSGLSSSYKINLIYFSDWSTWFMFFAFPMGIYLLFRSRDRDIPAIFLATLLLNMASMSDEAYRFLSLILPSRLIIVSWILSWIIVSFFISVLVKRIGCRSGNKMHERTFTFCFRYGGHLAKISLSQKGVKALALKLTFIVLVSTMLYPSLYRHFTLYEATAHAWYSRSPSFPYDYNASVWISQNVSPDELILNDMSWSGFYLPSYTFKKVIFHYFPHPPEWNEARLIWLHADNETLVKDILKKLGIKWIFVTSEWNYLDAWMYGGSGKYMGKPFNPATYIKIFDSYTFLKKMYQCGNSAVYKVSLSGDET